MKYLLSILLVLTVILMSLAGYLYVLTNSPQSSAQTSFNQPFTLTNQDGITVTEKTFLGKPTLYFFGFTHCPDICPTTLGTLTNWLNSLGEDASKLNVVFVSVDPERDTPASLKTYISNFHPQITAATGSLEQLNAMAKIFMVYFAKVPPSPGQDPSNYMVSHSSGILMADSNGIFQGMLDSHDPDATAIESLKKLLKAR